MKKVIDDWAFSVFKCTTSNKCTKICEDCRDKLLGMLLRDGFADENADGSANITVKDANEN